MLLKFTFVFLAIARHVLLKEGFTLEQSTQTAPSFILDMRHLIYGPGFVNAIKGPQPWTKIMPTGGVSPTEENLKGWFDAGVSCVGIGSKLFTKEIVRNKDFEGLKLKVQEALELIEGIRN